MNILQRVVKRKNNLGRVEKLNNSDYMYFKK